MRFFFILCAFFSISICAEYASFVPSTGLKYNEEIAQIGKKLFFDKRISEEGSLSCESCHNLYWDFSGTHRKPAEEGDVTPPSILNSALNYLFFHNGRIRSIDKQVEESITARNQLNTSKTKILNRVSSISEYRILFSKNFKDGITFDNIITAFVEFERAILTTNSPFDRYLMGDENALTLEQKRGFEIFKNIGCVACHNGINLGTNLVQEINFYKDIFENTNDDSFSKKSLYNVSSLRNIARTAPYLSDGSVKNLKQIIGDISQMQLLYKPSQEEIELLYKFLISLNGERPRILQ